MAMKRRKSGREFREGAIRSIRETGRPIAQRDEPNRLRKGNAALVMERDVLNAGLPWVKEAMQR